MHFPKQVENLFQKILFIGFLLLGGLCILYIIANWKKILKVYIENEMWECLIEEGQL